MVLWGAGKRSFPKRNQDRIGFDLVLQKKQEVRQNEKICM